MLYTILGRLTALGADVKFSVSGDTIHAILQDFEDFDESWRVIKRKYNDEDAINAFIEWCENTADTYTTGIVTDFHFGDIILWLDYASCASADT